MYYRVISSPNIQCPSPEKLMNKSAWSQFGIPLIFKQHISLFIPGTCHNQSSITLMENISEVTEFILAGLTDAPELQIPLFIIFTLIYLIALFGNLGMIMLILLDSRLHSPMYFFLCNLSLVDCVYASAVTPKVMEGFLTGNKIISYNACAAQMFFFVAFIAIESLILASMAYDRHAAVCKPLHYTTIMTSTTCILIVTCCYMCGILQSSVHVALAFHLFFCFPISILEFQQLNMSYQMFGIMNNYNLSVFFK